MRTLMLASLFMPLAAAAASAESRDLELRRQPDRRLTESGPADAGAPRFGLSDGTGRVADGRPVRQSREAVEMRQRMHMG